MHVGALVGTSVVDRLLPQDPLQVPGPEVLHLPADGLKRVRVLGFPLPEPDLKAQPTVAAVLGHAHIACLNVNRDQLIT